MRATTRNKGDTKAYVLSLLDAAGDDGLSSNELFALDPKRFINIERASPELTNLWKSYEAVRVPESRSIGSGLRYRYYHLDSKRGKAIVTELAKYDQHARKLLQKCSGSPKKVTVPLAHKPGTASISVRVEKQVVINLGEGVERTISEDVAKSLYQSLQTIFGR